MNPQTLGPFMAIEGLANGDRLLCCAGHDHQPEAAFFNERGKLTELFALAEIRGAFPGDMIGWSTQVDANQFQSVLLDIRAMRCLGERGRKPTAAVEQFLFGQSLPKSVPQRGIQQHAVFHRQRLWPQRNRAMSADAESLCAPFPEHVIERRVEQRIFTEQTGGTQAAQDLADRIPRNIWLEQSLHDIDRC